MKPGFNQGRAILVDQPLDGLEEAAGLAAGEENGAGLPVLYSEVQHRFEYRSHAAHGKGFLHVTVHQGLELLQ